MEDVRSMVQCDKLVKSFNIEEVKQAVCDYDGYKSPWPDVINFGFIKDFLVKLKDDFMLFLSKFH